MIKTQQNDNQGEAEEGVLRCWSTKEWHSKTITTAGEE